MYNRTKQKALWLWYTIWAIACTQLQINITMIVIATLNAFTIFFWTE